MGDQDGSGIGDNGEHADGQGQPGVIELSMLISLMWRNPEALALDYAVYKDGGVFPQQIEQAFIDSFSACISYFVEQRDYKGLMALNRHKELPEEVRSQIRPAMARIILSFPDGHIDWKLLEHIDTSFSEECMDAMRKTIDAIGTGPVRKFLRERHPPRELWIEGMRICMDSVPYPKYDISAAVDVIRKPYMEKDMRPETVVAFALETCANRGRLRLIYDFFEDSVHPLPARIANLGGDCYSTAIDYCIRHREAGQLLPLMNRRSLGKEMRSTLSGALCKIASGCAKDGLVNPLREMYLARAILPWRVNWTVKREMYRLIEVCRAKGEVYPPYVIMQIEDAPWRMRMKAEVALVRGFQWETVVGDKDTLGWMLNAIEKGISDASLAKFSRALSFQLKWAGKDLGIGPLSRVLGHRTLPRGLMEDLDSAMCDAIDEHVRKDRAGEGEMPDEETTVVEYVANSRELPPRARAKAKEVCDALERQRQEIRTRLQRTEAQTCTELARSLRKKLQPSTKAPTPGLPRQGRLLR